MLLPISVGILVRAAATATPRPRSGAEAGGPYAREEAAKRSYPTSEVRGKRQRVPGCDGAGTAKRSSLTSEDAAKLLQSCPTLSNPIDGSLH